MLKTIETLGSRAATERLHNNVVNLRAFRKRNLPYVFIWILYYAWVVAFTTWWTASPVTEMVFNTGLRSLIHSINLLSSAVFIFLIKKEWFVLTSRVGALLIITGMATFLLLPKNSVQLVTVIAIGITLGIVNISILIPFVFALNNTEKFYSVILSNVVINLIMMVQCSFLSGKSQGSKEQLLTMILLVIPLCATIFFKKSGAKGEYPEAARELKPRFYLTLIYNCSVAILCKGAGKGILDITAGLLGNSIYQWYYLGGLFGCIMFIAVYALTKNAVIWLNNILFSSMAMGLLCNAFIEEVPQMAYVFAILLGIGCTIGMINMYYILGVVGKKYNSMRYLRLSILFIGICGGVSGVMVGNLINKINTYQISIIASVIAAAFMLIFLMLSPFLAQAQYFEDWAKDSDKMEIGDDLDIFRKYNLSKREIEVCKLLLEGYTLRQVSAILSIAYSTVNTYCTSTYRKLNINSRTELIMLFKEYVK